MWFQATDLFWNGVVFDKVFIFLPYQPSPPPLMVCPPLVVEGLFFVMRKPRSDPCFLRGLEMPVLEGKKSFFVATLTATLRLHTGQSRTLLF